jgi:MFS transporter, PAT family, beta-lactamase induction signal transducer AmpG
MSVQSSSSTKERDALGALLAFVERRSLVMLALGFSAGLPFLLIFDTLSAWLRVAGLSLEVIGFFSLTTLIYSFKFLWAPLIDRARVPVLTQWLGHRRSWMILCQALIMLGLWLIAGSDPVGNLALMAVFAVFVGFSSATQDVVIDAWRIEAAEISKQGVMAAAYQWGYRIAMIVAGAAPLLLAESYSWNFSYAVMAALMAIGMLAVLLAPREARHVIRPIPLDGVRVSRSLEIGEWLLRLLIVGIAAVLLGSGLAGDARVLVQLLSAIGLDSLGQGLLAAWRPPYGVWFQLLSVLAGFGVLVIATMPVPGLRTRPGLYLAAALGDPLRDFFTRYQGSAVLILALICTYRLSDFVLNIMNPFYLDLGFTLTEVAEVRKIFGVAASVLGVFAGGFAVARLGLMRALLIGAFAGPVSNLVFIWLATQGHSVPALFVAIGLDNVGSGFAGTALIAYMSSLTAEGFTATQYALFSSLYALPGRLVASQSGSLVEGAAQAADAGGYLSLFNGWFAGLPPESFAKSVERSGVSAAALGSGYTVFFIYSALVGVFAVVLAFVVASRRAKLSPGLATKTPVEARS